MHQQPQNNGPRMVHAQQQQQQHMNHSQVKNMMGQQQTYGQPQQQSNIQQPVPPRVQSRQQYIQSRPPNDGSHDGINNIQGLNQNNDASLQRQNATVFNMGQRMQTSMMMQPNARTMMPNHIRMGGVINPSMVANQQIQHQSAHQQPIQKTVEHHTGFQKAIPVDHHKEVDPQSKTNQVVRTDNIKDSRTAQSRNNIVQNQQAVEIDPTVKKLKQEEVTQLSRQEDAENQDSILIFRRELTRLKKIYEELIEVADKLLKSIFEQENSAYKKVPHNLELSFANLINKFSNASLLMQVHIAKTKGQLQTTYNLGFYQPKVRTNPVNDKLNNEIKNTEYQGPQTREEYINLMKMLNCQIDSIDKIHNLISKLCTKLQHTPYTSKLSEFQKFRENIKLRKDLATVSITNLNRGFSSYTSNNLHDWNLEPPSIPDVESKDCDETISQSRRSVQKRSRSSLYDYSYFQRNKRIDIFRVFENLVDSKLEYTKEFYAKKQKMNANADHVLASQKMINTEQELKRIEVKKENQNNFAKQQQGRTLYNQGHPVQHFNNNDQPANNESNEVNNRPMNHYQAQQQQQQQANYNESYQPMMNNQQQASNQSMQNIPAMNQQYNVMNTQQAYQNGMPYYIQQQPGQQNGQRRE